MAKSTKNTKPAVKTVDQLKTDLAAKQKDLIDAKLGHRQGELTNPRVITATRKEIARLHTAIKAAMISEKGEK